MGWEMAEATIKTLFGIQETSTIDLDKSRGPRDILLALRTISGLYLLFSALHGAHCLSSLILELTNFIVEK